LWKSLLVTEGDLLVFMDADLTHWGPHFVTGLLGPLLHDERVLLVKGFYERLYRGGVGPNWPVSSSRSLASGRPAAT
jgi:glucosyl-3-phosphoglycerate synthase